MKYLPVRKYVRDYGLSLEAEVLEAVKQYPTSSVDKLQKILPHIKRHKIQRVLENKGLSTLEQRLAFTGPSRARLEKYLKKDRPKSLLKRVKIPRPSFPKIPPEFSKQLKRKGAFVVLGILILATAISIAKSVVFAQVPIIRLQEPSQDSLVQSKRVFVSGLVEPAQSNITANGKKVALNGDGGFTAYIDVTVGENVLEVEAVHWFKKARVLRVIKRELSPEEIRAKAEEEKDRQELAELEQGATDVLAVRRARNEKDPVRIIKSSIVEEGKLTRVEGEVFNFGEKELSFIQATAIFLDEKGKVLDTKSGLVEGFGEVLRSGQKASFETQPTSRKFYSYELSLEWEEVAGESGLEESGLPEEERI